MAASAGLFLDDWQQWVLTEALAERRDGRWAAFEVALLVPRQNGKNAILEALELAAIYLWGESLVVHSAHRFDTSTEHFLRMKSLIQEIPDLDRKVAHNGFVTANGKEAIKFRSGARIKFIARSRGGARGFTGDRVILDEAYDLPAKVIGAMMPTMSTKSGQIWYASSAAHVDSAHLHTLRRRALEPSALDARLFYAEWGVEPDVDPGSEDAWYEANPALGIRITREYVENEFRAMMDMPEEFARERLGIPDGLDGAVGVIPIAQWDSLIDPGMKLDPPAPYEMQGRVRLALDVSEGGRWSSICAVEGDEEMAHLEVVDRRPGTDWLAAEAIKFARHFQCPVSIAMTGPALAQIPLLTAAGVDVIEVGPTEAMRAAAKFVEAATNSRLMHRGTQELRNAITGCTVTQRGDLNVWIRATSTADITPLVACSIALAANEPLTFVY